MTEEAVLIDLMFSACVITLGIYTITHRSFPGWLKGAGIWPLVRVTPAIAVQQGSAAVLAGSAAVAFVISRSTPGPAAGALLFVALGCGLAGAMLVAYSTWLSRRLPPERPRS